MSYEMKGKSRGVGEGISNPEWKNRDCRFGNQQRRFRGGEPINYNPLKEQASFLSTDAAEERSEMPFPPQFGAQRPGCNLWIVTIILDFSDLRTLRITSQTSRFLS
jgi:hypothetical protein